MAMRTKDPKMSRITVQTPKQSTMIQTRMTLIGALKELKYGAWIRDVEAIAPWLT